MGHLDDIDAERLVAVSIAHEADWRAPDPHVVTAAAERESYVPRRRPTHHWHQRMMSLRPMLAAVFDEFVGVDAAVRMLHERRKVAVAAGDDPDTVASCDAVLIELCRSYRTTELSESVHRLALDGAPELRAQALAVLALVKGESAADPEHAGSWHLWWRTQVIAGSHLGGLARHPRYAALGAVPVPDLVTQVDQLELDWLFNPSPG